MRSVDYMAPIVAQAAFPATFSTNGSTTFVLTGTNLGPVSQLGVWAALKASVRASYGSGAVQYSVLCQVTIDSTTVTCTAAEGMGSLLSVVLSVGGQNASVPGTVSYRFPVITSLRSLAAGVVAGAGMPTAGCLVGVVLQHQLQCDV